MIFISGWMQQPDDDKRTIGILPSDEHLSLEERLYRYYKKLIQVGTDDGTELRRYAEKKMIGYKDEASRWEHYAKKNESTLDVLYDNLEKSFGENPSQTSSLILPQPKLNLDDDNEIDMLVHDYVDTV